MPAQARVETRATWNDVDLQAGIRASENKLQGFQTRVSRLFRRTPERRAEQALSGFVADLSGGNVAGAITGITSRMTGFGLAIGVAVGAGVELFSKFKNDVDNTDASARKLANTLAVIGGARGPEELSKEFEAVTSQVEDLIQKTSSGGSTVSNFLDKFVNPLLGTSSKHKGESQAAEITSGLDAAGKLLSDRAKAESDVVDIKEKSLSVSEALAAREKILLDASIKKAAIDREAKAFKLSLFAPELSGKLDPLERNKLIVANEAQAKSRKATIDRAANIDLKTEEQKADAKSRAVTVEQQLADLALKGESAERRKIEALTSELGLIQTQLKTSQQLSAEQLAQLNVSQTKTKTAIRDEQLSQFLKPESQLQKERDAEEKHQEDLQRFKESRGLHNIHRGLSGAVIGGTDPTTGLPVSLVNNDPFRDGFFPPKPKSTIDPVSATVGIAEQQDMLTKADMAEIAEKYWGD